MMNDTEMKAMNPEDQTDENLPLPEETHQTHPQLGGRRLNGFAATSHHRRHQNKYHQLGPTTGSPKGGGKREREREKEKERTKLRERHRRAITSRMLAGLRQYGNFPLPARADMNDVLAALARQAGWLVDPDGITCWPHGLGHGQHYHHDGGDGRYNNNNNQNNNHNCQQQQQQSSSRESLVDVDVDVDSLLPIHDTHTMSPPTSLDSVAIAHTAEAPKQNQQIMQQEQDFPSSTPTPYVPIYVKLSSGVINNFCQLVDPESVRQELTQLQSLNVDGVVVHCWWGIVETWTPQKYIWSGYSNCR